MSGVPTSAPPYTRPDVPAWQRLLAIFGGAIVVLVVGAFVYLALRRAREAQQLVAHTHQTIETLSSTLSDMQDAETGQRGFLITGADSYLEPYSLGLMKLDADTIALRRLTAGDAHEQRRLDSLSALVRVKTEELARTIALRRTQGFDAAAAAVQTGQGKESMDGIRRLLGSMQSEEDSLILSRQQAEQRRAQEVVILLLVGTLVATLVGVLVNALLARYAKAQERAAHALGEQNTRLTEQTHELEGQRELLQDQASELESQNEQLQEQATELEAQTAQLAEQAFDLERANDELRRSAEFLRARTDEAVRASTAKSEFLAAMSHELRTPLNAIVGYVDLMAMGIRGPVTEQQHEDLRRIKRSGRHLLTLINEILDLARVEAGQIDLRLSSVPMADFLADVSALVLPQMERKGITFTAAKCDPALVAQIDAERTRQILLNLLTNAQKFTDPGGKVAVECGTDPYGVSPAGAPTDTVSIRVTDTGRGIPADRLKGIFEPFVQIDRRLTPDGEQGLGLGLSISRDLAQAMGGDLTVESVVGRGSTFTLHLPVAESGAVDDAAHVSAHEGEPAAEPGR